MSDLISREALKAIVERRMDMQDLYLPAHFLDIADGLPTTDAVEVVRCKDCKYSTPDIMSEDYRTCWEHHTVMPNDGFCSAPTENARR